MKSLKKTQVDVIKNIKAMDSLSHGWRIDRCTENTPGRKMKVGTLFFFFFGLPTLNLELLVPQKWFTYQNLQNFTRKNARLFLEQFIPEEKIKLFRNKNYMIENRKIVFKGLNNE